MLLKSLKHNSFLTILSLRQFIIVGAILIILFISFTSYLFYRQFKSYSNYYHSSISGVISDIHQSNSGKLIILKKYDLHLEQGDFAFLSIGDSISKPKNSKELYFYEKTDGTFRPQLIFNLKKDIYSPFNYLAFSIRLPHRFTVRRDVKFKIL